jgi:phosphatidate cytidylyltransferase
MIGVAFDNPAILPSVAGRIGAVLGVGLAVVAAARQVGGRGLAARLFVQWRTWLLAGVVYVVGIGWSRWTAFALVVALATQGSREFADVLRLDRPYRRALIAASACMPTLLLVSPKLWPASGAFVALAATLVPLIRQDVVVGPQQLSTAVLGYVLVPWTLGFVLLTRELVPGGVGILFGIGLSVAMSDVLAFAVGSAASSRLSTGTPGVGLGASEASRLAPVLSPAKTRIGLLGNLGGAFGGWWLMGPVLPGWLPGIAGWLMPVTIAAAAIWGDLIESLLKRHGGVKDAGRCLPGFGGLLDRIDSLLVVLPACYVVLEVLR